MLAIKKITQLKVNICQPEDNRSFALSWKTLSPLQPWQWLDRESRCCSIGCRQVSGVNYADKYIRMRAPDNIWLESERKGGAPGLFLPVLKHRTFHTRTLPGLISILKQRKCQWKSHASLSDSFSSSRRSRLSPAISLPCYSFRFIIISGLGLSFIARSISPELFPR